jgi:hypothetical protein
MTTMTDQEFINGLRQTAAGRALLEEREAARQTERRQLAADLERVTREREKAGRELQKTRAAAAARVQEARQSLDDAKAALQAAEGVIAALPVRFNDGPIRTRLAETASSLIDVGIARFVRENTALVGRSAGFKITPRAGHSSDPRFAPRPLSDSASAAARLEACTAAIRVLEALRWQVRTDGEIQAEIDQLWRGLPALEWQPAREPVTPAYRPSAVASRADGARA